MKTTFNLISYHTGCIRKTIQAETPQEAKDILESKGYDCIDDHYIESDKQTNEYNKQNLNGRTIYVDETM
jgi:hypothetical protein